MRIRDVTGAADRVTIDASGNVGIGTASPGYKLDVNGNLGVNTIYIAAANKIFQSRNDATLEYAQEYNRNGSRIGGIYLDSSSLQYITTSDRRFKENIATTTQGLSSLLNIPVKDFNFISDPNKTTQQGFIAQDLYNYYPVAVTVGGASATTSPWGVDYGRLTPLLVQSIQDLNAKFEERTKFIANAATSTVLTVDVAGNVGIGTSTPVYKLQVIGDVAAQSFVNISTRDSKKDISYLSAADNETALEKLKNLFVARYRYEAEDTSAPLRTGLIAEEAPEEVLAAGGKGIDLYKFVSFLTSGVKALVAKVDAVIVKVASFADVFTTKKLCVSDDGGAETCVTKSQLDSILAGVGSSGSSVMITTTTTDSTTVATTTSTTNTTTSTTTDSTTTSTTTGI